MEVSRVNAPSVQDVPHHHRAADAIEPDRKVEAKDVEVKPSTELTQPEKEYFAAAFPQAANEIRQHVLYQRKGIQQPSSLGSVIDRRG
jgi:hypothetical protein